jgi:hypothetical protein
MPSLDLIFSYYRINGVESQLNLKISDNFEENLNPKHQIRGKSQMTSTKCQTNSNVQITNDKQAVIPPAPFNKGGECRLLGC